MDLDSSVPPLGSGIDIWAMGVSLYCLMFGKVPFAGVSEFDLFHIISKNPYFLLIRLVFPNAAVSDDLKDLISRMLDKDPISRLTMNDIKFHKWTTKDMNNIDKMNWWNELSSTYQFEQPLESRSFSLSEKVRKGFRKITDSIHKLGDVVSIKEDVQLPIDMGVLPLSLERTVELIKNGQDAVGAKWTKWDCNL